MEIKWIEDFIALSDVKNFSQAALLRNVTQPHFSRRIQALERWLGVALIDRRTYPVGLTPAGKIFRETALSIVTDLYHDKNAFRQEFSKTTADVRISAATTLLLNFIPEWLQSIRNATTHFSVNLATRNFHDMVQALADGDTDFVMQFAHPDIPPIFDESKFDSLLLAKASFLPVSSVDKNGQALHQLPGTKQQPIPYFTYSDDGYFSLVESLLCERNLDNPLHLKPQDTTPTAEVLKSLVLANDGVAWLPENCIEKELATGQLAVVGDSPWATEIEIRLYRSQDHHRPLTTRIWDAASSQCQG